MISTQGAGPFVSADLADRRHGLSSPDPGRRPPPFAPAATAPAGRAHPSASPDRTRSSLYSGVRVIEGREEEGDGRRVSRCARPERRLAPHAGLGWASAPGSVRRRPAGVRRRQQSRSCPTSVSSADGVGVGCCAAAGDATLRRRKRAALQADGIRRRLEQVTHVSGMRGQGVWYEAMSDVLRGWRGARPSPTARPRIRRSPGGSPDPHPDRTRKTRSVVARGLAVAHPHVRVTAMVNPPALPTPCRTTPRSRRCSVRAMVHSR